MSVRLSKTVYYYAIYCINIYRVDGLVTVDCSTNSTLTSACVSVCRRTTSYHDSNPRVKRNRKNKSKKFPPTKSLSKIANSASWRPGAHSREQRCSHSHQAHDLTLDANSLTLSYTHSLVLTHSPSPSLSSLLIPTTLHLTGYPTHSSTHSHYYSKHSIPQST